jgi:hypothetical protein
MSRNKARSRQEHVNLTLRVTEELLEHLDGWRIQQISRPSRNATVVAILEEWISGKAPAVIGAASVSLDEPKGLGDPSLPIVVASTL